MLFRLSAAFGVDAMLLGERCCDPFFRQSVRVSMGAVFKLPLVRSEHLSGDLARLRENWGFELAATVLSPDAEPLASPAGGPGWRFSWGAKPTASRPNKSPPATERLPSRCGWGPTS